MDPYAVAVIKAGEVVGHGSYNAYHIDTMVAEKGQAAGPRAEGKGRRGQSKGRSGQSKADAAMTKAASAKQSRSGHNENTLLQQSVILKPIKTISKYKTVSSTCMAAMHTYIYTRSCIHIKL